MQGRANISLTVDARQVLSERRPPDVLNNARWMTSPLSRARETARALGIADAQVDDRLIETDWGDWQGKTIKGLREDLGEAFLENEGKGRDFRPPHGESPADVIIRIRSFLAMVGAQAGPYAVVTHKGVIRAVLALAYDWDMTTKAPVKLTWQAAHLFDVSPEGHPSPLEMNVPLPSKAVED